MSSSNNLYCFVCDVGVTNRYFYLAECRTQTSKKELIEKLGQLVGDKFMVVITEDDIICRSCANLMNTLDRLEIETNCVRRVVLRFLEKKYNLTEGTLLSQITSSGNNASPVPHDKMSSPNFMVRKKKAQEEVDEMSSTDCVADDPRSRIWMQCNKCQYTTNYTSFVNNHIRKEVCLNCEAPVKDGLCTEDCSKEMAVVAAADATDQLDEGGEGSAEEASDDPLEGESTEPPVPMSLIEGDIQFLNGGEGSLSLMEGNLGGILEEGEEKPAALYLQYVNEGGGEGAQSSTVGQVLAVTQDGAVEMMQVLWDEDAEIGDHMDNRTMGLQ